MDTTVEEMLADYYAHLYTDDPKAAEEVEDDDFDPDEVGRLIGMEPENPGDWEGVE